MNRIDLIKNFLTAETRADLAELYSGEMEVQVNVAQGMGERVKGDYKGRSYTAFSDGVEKWKSFRIPWKAMTDPEYEDSPVRFTFHKHVEAIGMTGWNWVNRESHFVAFDFDSIIGHSTGLRAEELKEIEDIATRVSWITVRKSTSGKGLHLYVFFDPKIPTRNHGEHAALGRAVLGKLSAETGFNFEAKIDVCGGVMWNWHRKMKGTDGLELIKKGVPLINIPANWRDHIPVITGKRKRNLPSFLEGDKEESLFDQIVGQTNRITLDDQHQTLLTYLTANSCEFWWDSDHWMLVCHTFDLQEAHKDLDLRGIFSTKAEGREHGADHNCFCFPSRNGSWAVRRYTQGVEETSSWDQDASGYTRCYLNKLPDLKTTAKAFGAIENTKAEFIFQEAEIGVEAAESLGVTLKIPQSAAHRTMKLKEHKDGRLVVELPFMDGDQDIHFPGWVNEKKSWQRLNDVPRQELGMQELQENFDDILRHVVSADVDSGWLIYSDTEWIAEPLTHVTKVMNTMGIVKTAELNNILGNSILNCWRLVNIPFGDEYPGNRQWNRNSAQLKFAPKETNDLESLDYPHWLKIMDHCGANLDTAVADNAWCQLNGIEKGRDYLMCWVASMFQEPYAHLPYLFFHGPQNSGKSTFHEALLLLFRNGSILADQALMNDGGFNAELEGKVLCIVEETDMGHNRVAYNRIKMFVTGEVVSIHRKNQTPYDTPNTSHWIQCANEQGACPIFPGDSRILSTHVSLLQPHELIPKPILFEKLEKEAPDFITACLKLELPTSNDRLNLPLLETQDRIATQEAHETSLQTFIREECHHIPGDWIKFSAFYAKFEEWLEPGQSSEWTRRKTASALVLIDEFVKGRNNSDNQVMVGNLGFEKKESTGSKYINNGDHLILVPNDS